MAPVRMRAGNILREQPTPSDQHREARPDSLQLLLESVGDDRGRIPEATLYVPLVDPLVRAPVLRPDLPLRSRSVLRVRLRVDHILAVVVVDLASDGSALVLGRCLRQSDAGKDVLRAHL